MGKSYLVLIAEIALKQMADRPRELGRAVTMDGGKLGHLTTRFACSIKNDAKKISPN